MDEKEDKIREKNTEVSKVNMQEVKFELEGNNSLKFFKIN